MQRTGQPWRERAGASAAQMLFRKGKPLLGCLLGCIEFCPTVMPRPGLCLCTIGPVHSSTVCWGSAAHVDVLLAVFLATGQAGTRS